MIPSEALWTHSRNVAIPSKYDSCYLKALILSLPTYRCRVCFCRFFTNSSCCLLQPSTCLLISDSWIIRYIFTLFQLVHTGFHPQNVLFTLAMISAVSLQNVKLSRFLYLPWYSAFITANRYFFVHGFTAGFTHKHARLHNIFREFRTIAFW
jgi:hypothetical protein